MQLNPHDKLVLASHNKGKLEEFRFLLAPYAITLFSASDFSLPEPEEVEDSFEGNARLKAIAAAQTTRLPALADDSGFCVEAIEGRPGIHSARWGGPEKDFNKAMRRIHEEMNGSSNHKAWFISILCIAWPDGTYRSFEGRVDGQFVWPPRGHYGHGYDPVFQPEGTGTTFAEMLEQEKNKMSHRGRAFSLFQAACLPPLNGK